MLEIDKKLVGIKKRLLSKAQEVSDASGLKPDLSPQFKHKKQPVDAAVMVALVERENHYSVLYIERSKNLRTHSGQIAFVGGKIDDSDENAAAAAIREAEEELAINPNDVEILGYLPTMFTGTNYLITPVVAIVRPRSEFIANEAEVASFFEVPLGFLCNEKCYRPYEVFYQKKLQTTWEILYDNKRIWGITAHITRKFWDLSLKGNEQW